jgi:hypothetical protein
LDEAVLQRPIGGHDVMRKQLRHLIEVSESSNITLQALPFSVGEHSGLDAGFTIVGFPDPLDPDVVYLEHATGTLYLEDVNSVDRYVSLFDQLRTQPSILIVLLDS